MPAAPLKYNLGALGRAFRQARVHRYEDPTATDLVLIILSIAALDFMVAEHASDCPTGSSGGGTDGGRGRNGRYRDRSSCHQRTDTRYSERCNTQECACDASTSDYAGNRPFACSVLVVADLVLIRTSNERDRFFGYAGATQLSDCAPCLFAVVEYR